MSETNLKLRVLRYLRTLNNIWVYKSSDRFTSGIPDILMCYNGQFVAIELKVRPNRATMLQEHIISKLRESGAIAEVCYSLDEVKDVMRRAGLVTHGKTPYARADAPCPAHFLMQDEGR